MRYFIKILSITLSVLVILTLSACDFDESKNHLSGGQLLDDEKISEIKNEILSGETNTEIPEDKTENATTAKDENYTDSGNTVYWTESGELWHESVSCSYLKNSAKILSGSIAEAQSEGKSRVCSRCSD